MFSDIAALSFSLEDGIAETYRWFLDHSDSVRGRMKFMNADIHPVLLCGGLRLVLALHHHKSIQ